MKSYSIGRNRINKPGQVIGAPSIRVWDPQEVDDRYHFEGVCDIKPLQLEPDKWDTAKQVPATGVEHEYLGPFAIDIDSDNLAEAYDKAKRVVAVLLEQGLETHSKQWRIFFSGGKGYHIEVHHSALGIAQHVRSLPLIYKGCAAHLGILPLVDSSVYAVSFGCLWRRPNIPRWINDGQDNAIPGPCKVYLSYDEFTSLTWEQHKELSKSPRPMAALEHGPAHPKLCMIRETVQLDTAKHRERGMLKKDIQPLLSYAYGSNLADCVKKVLSHDPSVVSNTHQLIFKLSLYFHHTGHSLEDSMEKAEGWLKKHVSNTYPTPKARTEHFQAQYEHVRGVPEYKFSCDVMRATVKDPACEICPLNRDFSPKTKTYGVIEWERQYHLIKKLPGKSETWERFPLSNFVIYPKRVAKTTDRSEPQSTFLADIVFADGRVAKNRLIDLAWVDKPEIFRSKLGELTGTQYVISCIATAPHMQGVRMLLDLRQREAPLFIDAHSTQGLHRFTGDNGSDGWYYVDHKGCRKEGWERSENVQLRTENLGASCPVSHLSQHKPLSTSEHHEVSNMLQMIKHVNAKRIMMPILGWMFATAFRERFRRLKDQSTVPHIDNFPMFFYQGEAETGKSQLAEFLLKPLYAMKYAEIDIATNSMAALRRGVLCMSNTMPVILDEWKEEIFSSRFTTSAFSTSDAKSLARSAWGESLYNRATKEGGTVEFKLECPLFLMGPTIPSFFDQAMRDRTVSVTGSPQVSRQHEAHWNRFYAEAIKYPDMLPRIGATIINTAMQISDTNLLKLYEFSSQYYEKLESQIRTRKYVGLTKMVFGHVVMQKIFGVNIWNAQDACMHLLSSVGVTTKDSGEISDIDVDQSDWDKIMDDFLSMASFGFNIDYKLNNGVDYTISTVGGELILTLNLDSSFDQRKRYKKSLGETASSMDPVAFARQAFSKGFLRMWDSGAPISRNLEIGVGAKHKLLRGRWIQLKVTPMQEGTGRQTGYSFSTVEGMGSKATTWDTIAP